MVQDEGNSGLSLGSSTCSHESSPAPKILRPSIGPSPWAFLAFSQWKGGFTYGSVNYHFRDTAQHESKLAGLTSLQDNNGATLLVFDFECYVRILEEGQLLLWREDRRTEPGRLIFDSLPLSSLEPVADPLATAREVRKEEIGVGPLPVSQHWEFPTYMEPGVHPISVPYDWAGFEETLALAEHEKLYVSNRRALAIFAFDWCKSEVEVFPQDWFNCGGYEFDYQWVSQVARTTDGSIVGKGARLACFELDKTNRRRKRTLDEDPFHGS